MKIMDSGSPETKCSFGYRKLPPSAADRLPCLLWHILALKEVRLALASP